MKLWKKSSVLFSCLSILSISAIAPVLSSCMNKNIKHDLVLDSKQFANIRQYTAQEWISFIRTNNVNKLNLIIDAFQQINNNWIIYGLNDLKFKQISQTLNQNNHTWTNLHIEIIYLNNYHINLTITNLFIYNANAFTAPTQTNVTLDQVDMLEIADIHHSNINDNQWIKAINDTQNGNGHIIPAWCYGMSNKELINNSSNYQQYKLTFSVLPWYKEQINTLADNNEYVDVVVTINLSPYINKVLQQDFELPYAVVKQYFGETITIDELKNKSEKQTYDLLKQYVDSLNNIQPLRDCVTANDSNKITKWHIANNIVGNTQTLIITFASTYLPHKPITAEQYEYKFTLHFQ